MGRSVAARLLAFFLLTSVLVTVGPQAGAEEGAKRRALVIGNSAYSKGRLDNPANDVAAVTRALKAVGFSVTLKKDVTRRGMRRAVNEFAESLGSGDVVLVYYAGHGIELKGENYLLGVEFAAENEDDAVDEAYRVRTLLSRLSSRPGDPVTMVILDACRDDPYTRSWSRSAKGRGWAVIERAPMNTYIAFSSGPGETASDGAGRDNSPFAEAFTRHLSTPGLELDHFFRKVRAEVLGSSDNRQHPWSRHDMTSLFYFVPGGKGADSPDGGKTMPVDTRPAKVVKADPPPGAGKTSETKASGKCGGGVVDGQAGLEWVAGADLDTTWEEARSWVRNLGSECGPGWRLPTVNELSGLYRRGLGARNLPAGLETSGWFVWSSQGAGSSRAWGFSFYAGRKKRSDVFDSGGNRAFAVRRATD